MSYCRWSDGDFYIYDNVYGGISIHPKGYDGKTVATRSEALDYIHECETNYNLQCHKHIKDAIKDDLQTMGETLEIEGDDTFL